MAVVTTLYTCINYHCVDVVTPFTLAFLCFHSMILFCERILSEIRWEKAFRAVLKRLFVPSEAFAAHTAFFGHKPAAPSMGLLLAARVTHLRFCSLCMHKFTPTFSTIGILFYPSQSWDSQAVLAVVASILPEVFATRFAEVTFLDVPAK